MLLRAVTKIISEKPKNRSVEGLEAKDGVTSGQETGDTQSAGQQETMSTNDASDLILADVEETGVVENEENCPQTYVEDTDPGATQTNLRKRKPDKQKGKCKNEKQNKKIEKPKVPVKIKEIKWRKGKEAVIIENTNELKKTDVNNEFKSSSDDKQEQQQMESNIKISKETEKSSDTRKVVVYKEKVVEIGVLIRSVYQNKKLPEITLKDNTENKPIKHSNYQLDIIFIKNVLNGLFEQTLYIFRDAKGVKNVNKPNSIFTSFLDSNANDTGYCTIKYLGHSELRMNENVEVSGIQIIWEEFKLYSGDYKYVIKGLYKAMVDKGYGGTLEIFEWECFLIDRYHGIKREDLVAIRHLLLILRKHTTNPRKVFKMLYFLTCDVRIFNCIFSVANFNMAKELSFKSLKVKGRIHDKDHFEGSLIKELYKFIDQCIEILTRLKNTKALKIKVKYKDLCKENPDRWFIEIIKKIAGFIPGDNDKKDCVSGFLKHLLKMFSKELNEQKISKSFKVQLEKLLNVANY